MYTLNQQQSKIYRGEKKKSVNAFSKKAFFD